LSLNLFQAFTLVVCPVEAFVMVSPVDLGDFGVQGRGSLVMGKPLGKRRLPTRSSTRQHLVCLY